MNRAIVALVEHADRLLASCALAAAGDRSSLIIPMFHGVYPDRAAASSGRFDPQQGITLSDLSRLLQSFQRAGYRFVAPDDISAGLASDGKFIMLTFDDCYFNNVAVLPILREFRAPGVFFISVGHVVRGRAFWWDVLYREMTRAGHGPGPLQAARARCKRLRNSEIEEWLKAEFHLSDLRPAGDLDRPMTPSELKEFSQHPCAVIGNHTVDHAILTNYSAGEAYEQIEGAQQALLDITGRLPSCIAYPNGNCSAEIVDAAQRAGLSSGVVTTYGRNALPIAPCGRDRMMMRRVLPVGMREIESQCRVFRSPISMRSIARNLRSRLRTAQP